MLIIVEGCDLAGKTTFVAQLEEYIAARWPHHKVEVIHRGPPQRHVLEEYVHDLLHYVPGTGHDIICDRWHLGELIYGPILRGESKLDPAMQMYVEMFLKSRGAWQVHISTPLYVIEERFRERGDDLVGLHQLRQVHAAYNHMVLDQGDPTLASAVLLAQDSEHSASWLRQIRPPSYVGHTSPEIVLVGDRQGDSAGKTRPLYPLEFVPYPETSGHWLFSALEPNPHLGVFNACELESTEFLPKMRGVFRHAKFVALGQNAHKALDDAGVPHGTVPHPQYMRRFHYGKLEWYCDTIHNISPGDTAKP